MDPSIQSLNRFREIISKAEALSAEIACILRDSEQDHKPLIKKDLNPWLPSKNARTKAAVSRRSSKKKNGAAKQRKGNPPGREADAEDAVRPTVTDPTPQPLPVSPGLFSRYDREEIYQKVWKAPIEDVAKEYGITDFTLRKTCERLWIPIPNRGYWERKAAGQPVIPAPPLPKVEVQRKVRLPEPSSQAAA